MFFLYSFHYTTSMPENNSAPPQPKLSKEQVDAIIDEYAAGNNLPGDTTYFGRFQRNPTTSYAVREKDMHPYPPRNSFVPYPDDPTGQGRISRMEHFKELRDQTNATEGMNGYGPYPEEDPVYDAEGNPPRPSPWCDPSVRTFHRFGPDAEEFKDEIYTPKDRSPRKDIGQEYLHPYGRWGQTLTKSSFKTLLDEAQIKKRYQ